MSFLSHYVSDAYMPFHAVTYYDGQKVPSSGPEAGSLFAGEHSGIHSAVEGNLLESPLFRSTWQDYLETNAKNFTAEYVDPWVSARYGTATGQYYADLMIAEDNKSDRPFKSWYENMWDKCGDFYMERILNSSIATANCWYTAFIDAGIDENETLPVNSFTLTTALTQTAAKPKTPTTSSDSTNLYGLESILLLSLLFLILQRRKLNQ